MTVALQKDFDARFNYWGGNADPDPFKAVEMIAGTHPQMVYHDDAVHDVRRFKTKLNLDEHAVKVITHQSTLLPPHRPDFNFQDPQKVRDEYWPELRSIVRSDLGARVVTFTESVARISTDKPLEDHRDEDGRPKPVNGVRRQPTSGAPFHIVHNDFSHIGSRNALRAVRPTFFEENDCGQSVSDEDKQAFFKLREEIIKKEHEAMKASGVGNLDDWDGSNYDGPRWATFSLWRPLDVVQKDPLGILDPACLFSTPSSHAEKLNAYYSTPFPHKDRKGMDDYIGANCMPRPPKKGQQYRWFYLSDQHPDEILAVRFFDSEAWKPESKVMPFGGHSAFKLPDQEDMPARRSIETRGFVIW